MRLPAPPELKKLCQTVALLDAVIEPEWVSRYFSFDKNWAEGKTMASMRTGKGDEYFITFCSYGTILIGYSVGSPTGRWLHQFPERRAEWSGSVPPIFADEMNEPAFTTHEATVLLWNTGNESVWESPHLALPEGPSDDFGDLLFILDGEPVTYVRWANEYFDTRLRVKAVRAFYDHTPLTEAGAKQINPTVNYACLIKDAEEIGYPVADPEGAHSQ